MNNKERPAETATQQSDAAEVTTSTPTCSNTLVSCRFLSNANLNDMIKANELRIGNRLQNITVESITKTGVNFSSFYEGYLETEFEKLKPLLLDEISLLDFGFAKHGEWYILNSLLMPTSININLNIRKLTIGSNEEYFLDEFDFMVHSLQNLFYCLTGEELECVANGS